MRSERGYTLIEVMAALAIMCIVAAAAGTLLSAGIRYFERESRRFEGEELVDRIGKQLVGSISYATDLRISNQWEVQDGMTALAFDTDGHMSTAVFAEGGDGSMPEKAEIFGLQYFEGRTLRCSVAVKRETIRISLTLMKEEEEIYNKEISIRLINMELNGRKIKTPKDVLDNGVDPVVFYIELEDTEE